jgi:hypothetical protein
MNLVLMLRIDETSKTLVAPAASEYVPEAAPGRDELTALLSAGWDAFAAEIGQTQLKAIAAAPEPGIDILALDDSARRLVVVVVADGDAATVLGRALAAAAAVSAWDAEKLGTYVTGLAPGDSPRMILIGPEWDAGAAQTADWLVRRHGVEIAGYGVQAMRLGNERMMNFVGAYPASPDLEFVADVHSEASVPPPPAAVTAPVDLPAPPA